MQDAGDLIMHQVQALIYGIGFLVCASAQAADDCAIRMPFSNVVPELSRGCPEEKAVREQKARECIPISGALPTNAYSQIEIREPGHYCLTEDLHARIEFADRPAEPVLIVIRARDVILDLQGHTLGRGRLFKNSGGTGIDIVDPDERAEIQGRPRSILIKNGVLRDFKVGVACTSGFYPHHGTGLSRSDYDLTLKTWKDKVYDSKTKTWSTATVEHELPVVDTKLQVLTFARAGLVLENVSFINNQDNFRVYSQVAEDAQ